MKPLLKILINPEGHSISPAHFVIINSINYSDHSISLLQELSPSKGKSLFLYVKLMLKYVVG